MYISLGESRKIGFKQWSDSHQPKYGRGCDAEDGDHIVISRPGFTSSGMTDPVRLQHPTLLTSKSPL